MALPTAGAVFFCQKLCNSFCYVDKMVRSECLGLVKHIYLIQTIILIRLLWLSGISKYAFLLLTSIFDFECLRLDYPLCKFHLLLQVIFELTCLRVN